MATYASWSLAANDCSWYDSSSCDWGQVRRRGLHALQSLWVIPAAAVS